MTPQPSWKQEFKNGLKVLGLFLAGLALLYLITWLEGR